VCPMRRLWTVPGGDEARMRFVTDTLGVKLVTRQLPAESRALLRALLVARDRPLPAAWSSPPQTANGPASAATTDAGKRSGSPADGSDVPASWSSAAVHSTELFADSLVTGDYGATGPKFGRDFSNEQPAWLGDMPDGPSYLNGQTATASQQQQQPADAGALQTHINAGSHDRNELRVGSGEQTSGAQEPKTSVAPAMTYEALQGLLQKVSSVLQGAAPDAGTAPLEQVNQEAGLPPGL